ncbi:MAG: HEAT repeat domain-containing protein, partial [Anaerolineae bacterium]|nr:HEAT repeat domain-containing protein [Anaerolineae bacterium]
SRLAWGLGVGAGAGGAAVYVLKDRLKLAPPQREGAPAGEGRPGLAALIVPQAQRRYRAELAGYLQRLHLPGERVNLGDVLLEPRFLRPTQPTRYLDDQDEMLIQEADAARVIPFLHHLPAVYAAFNLETIGLQALESGERQVAILGSPGTGKSTALAALGLVGLGALTYEQLKALEALEESDDHASDLSRDQRDQQRKEREAAERSALERLRLVQRRTEEVEAAEQRDAAVDFVDLLPIYAHVRHLSLEAADYGGKIDPTEPIVRAQAHYLNRATAQLSPPMLYNALRGGRALLLLDGYDDLSDAERAPYAVWLKALTDLYGQNMIIITGPAQGYAGLVEAGFAPAFMAPWNPRRIARLIERWWPITARLSGEPLNEAQRQAILADTRNRSVLDLTAKILAISLGDLRYSGRRGYYNRCVRLALNEDEKALAVMQQSAQHWLNSGELPDAEALNGFLEAQVNNPNEASRLRALLQASPGVLALPDGRLTLAHVSLLAYLGAEELTNASENKLLEKSHLPLWHLALSFASGWVDLTSIVGQRLQEVRTAPDLLRSRIFAVADWMPDTPRDTRWKSEILKLLRGVLLSPHVFPTIREYALAALVTSRAEETAYLFREAIRSGDPHIRTLGCVGVGAVGSQEAQNDLEPMLVDEAFEVQLAAGLALAALGTEGAMLLLGRALLEGDQNLRRAVAESLASLPGVGHQTLRDGIVDSDLEVRRASAFGLARIPETWALVALYHAMLEDSQWSVRNAAEQAFAQAREPRHIGPRHYPEPQAYLWLADWAARRGDSVPEGPQGRQFLMRALEEAPQRAREEAARALGELGHILATKSLYGALMDREARVRMAAFRALATLSNRTGKPLPGI